MRMAHKIGLKTLVIIFISVFFACNPIEKNKKIEYRNYGIRLSTLKEFNIDGFRNYGAMYDSIENCLCRNVTPIIVLENDTAIFKTAPFSSECPKTPIIWCPNDNQLLEINTSSIFYPLLENTYPIDCLSVVLPQFYKEDFTRNEKHKNDSYRFTFIGFERNLPIISVKNTLEQLFIEFNKLKVENDSLMLLIDFREDEKFRFDNIVIEN
jgi:hypothetical protein